MSELRQHFYGKSRVRLVKLWRGPQHEVREFSVETVLEGDFSRSYTHSDNRNVIPTDTQKNVCYAVAHEHKNWRCAEEYSLAVAEKLLGYQPLVEKATVRVLETVYTRLPFGPDGTPHRLAFSRAPYMRTARVIASRSGDRVVYGGIRDYTLMKTSESGWKDFHKCQYTTLPPTTDRFFSTTLEAEWRLVAKSGPIAGDDIAARTIRAITEAFANRYSPSVQATLYWAGTAAIAEVPDLCEISLRMPNNHIIGPHDLRPLGIPGNDDVYVPIAEPHGTIEAVIARTSVNTKASDFHAGSKSKSEKSVSVHSRL